MKTGLLAFFILGLSLCASAFGGTCSEIEGRTAALDFYFSNQAFGFPTKAQLSKLQPHISTSLYELLSTAVRANEEDKRESSGDGSLYDDALFSRSAEGYWSFHISNAVPGTKNSEIFVLFQSPGYDFPSNVNHPGVDEWKESVKIVREGQACVVDDIHFYPKGSDEDLEGSLKNRLRKIISDYEDWKTSVKKEGAAQH